MQRLVNILLFLIQNRIMYKVLFLFFICFATKAQSQYYYNDILGNKQAKDNFLLLKTNEIKKVAVSTTDGFGEVNPSFAILQEIKANKNEMTTNTKSEMSPISILKTTYFPNGYPKTTVDSSENAVTVTTYTYNAAAPDNLAAIVSSSHEPGESAQKFSEQRIYSYDGALPKMMWRIKNGKDSMQVQFILEEHGWIGEERWIEKGRTIETYFYYYNETGKLTDVAQYNKRAKRILPNYTFEYDAKGRIFGMNAYVTGTDLYRTWRYSFDYRNLKTKETIFNKKQQAEGKVIYVYE